MAVDPTLRRCAMLVATHCRTGNLEGEVAARQDLTYQSIRLHVLKQLENSPPLRDEQRIRLAQLLGEVRGLPTARAADPPDPARADPQTAGSRRRE